MIIALKCAGTLLSPQSTKNIKFNSSKQKICSTPTSFQFLFFFAPFVNDLSHIFWLVFVGFFPHSTLLLNLSMCSPSIQQSNVGVGSAWEPTPTSGSAQPVPTTLL